MTKMAEFCKKHAKEFVGTKDSFEPKLSQKEYDLLLLAWTCEEGYICEECGYKYLEQSKGRVTNDE